jgi:hypothetical protein
LPPVTEHTTLGESAPVGAERSSFEE